MANPSAANSRARRQDRRGSPVSAHQLIEAAERCFARFGVERTTMNDVAREAHVHRATVYRHFAERNDLITAVLLKKSRPVMERAAGRATESGDASAAVVESLVTAIDDALSDAD